MGFDRISAKYAARESMRRNNPSPILVTIVYLALTSLLWAAISSLLYDPMDDMTHYVWMGFNGEEILNYILENHRQDLMVLGGLQVLYSFYCVYMNYGYASYSLRMARNEQPGVGRLFDGFVRPLRVLWASLLRDIFTFLWTLAVTLPFGILLLLGGVDMVNGTTMIMMVAMITAIAVDYRYRLAEFFLLDDPDCTARQAVRRSRDAMRGWKWTLFVLDYSFFGWMLLSAMLGLFLSSLLPVALVDVLAFWLTPYRAATVANFYDAITGPSRPSGGSIGPDYEYRTGQGPEPF